MDERMRNTEEISEVNLKNIMNTLFNKMWLVLLVSAISAVLVFAVTFFFVTPKYQSSAMFYVNNNSISVGDAALSIDSNDISASKSLVNTYIVILNTRSTLNDVIDYADVDRRYPELKDMIKAEPVDDTEVFQVVVTSENPQEANKIAEAISYILPKRITSVVEGTSAKIVDSSVVAAKPSSPSYIMNTLIGFLLGFVFAAGWIMLQEILDVTVRKEDDIAQACKHPILAMVPDMNAPSKGGYYYGGKHNRKNNHILPGKQNVPAAVVIGSGISFSASEAYKLLRTKLQFSFADENNCRVIGVSSALSGEGKSLSSINLAFALSQLDKKVLLMDCDMRRPSVADKLGILKAPGLSNFLTRQSLLEDLVQPCGLKDNEEAFHVITAGQNPPNPMELLSSERMKAALATVRSQYDYVILDLPPVGEVSDAMAVANETDGMLLVVRQNYCNRVSLSEAVAQFEFIRSRILGIVFNCTGEGGANYGRNYYRRYYHRYYRRYDRRYDKHYSTAVPETTTVEK